MNLKMKKSAETTFPLAPSDSTCPDDATPRTDGQNILVTHGIHRGRFPVGGLRIREARQVLAKLINIDPTAVPVINGRPVDDNTVIRENISMLSFVKPSSIKG